MKARSFNVQCSMFNVQCSSSAFPFIAPNCSKLQLIAPKLKKAGPFGSVTNGNQRKVTVTKVKLFTRSQHVPRFKAPQLSTLNPQPLSGLRPIATSLPQLRRNTTSLSQLHRGNPLPNFLPDGGNKIRVNQCASVVKPSLMKTIYAACNSFRSSIASRSFAFNFRFSIVDCRFAVVLLACLLTLPVAAIAATPSLRYSDASSPDFFPIMTWDPQHGWTKPFKDEPKNGLEAIAECNFNMAGFVFPKDLKKCEKLGMGALVLPVDQEDFTNFEYFRLWSKLPDAEIDARIKKVVDAASGHPAFAGVFIVDEPHVREFPGLAKAVAAVKKYAPGKLAYINLFPNYATLGAGNLSQLGTDSYTEYLERFVNEVHPQVISYDNYMVESSDDLKDAAKAASYYRNLLEVRRVAQKYHLPFLNIVTSNQIRPHTPIPSPQNLLMQAYTTLAAGYRGVTWYTFYARGYHYAPVGNDGNRTLTFYFLKEVNRQIATLAPILCKLQSTGVYFSYGVPPSGGSAPDHLKAGLPTDLPTVPGKLIDSLTANEPLMIGEFSGRNGEHYAMLVNLSLERTTQVKINRSRRGDEADSGIKIISAVNRSLSNYDQKLGFWLNAGQGVLVQL
jgi:hypothetical protein